MFELPSDAVLEVPIRHPELPWFEELQLRWHALPMVCDVALEAGGQRYPAAPFNGRYMSSEIGARTSPTSIGTTSCRPSRVAWV